MKKHMLICFFISMLVGMERDEMIITIINNYYEMSEVVRLGIG